VSAKVLVTGASGFLGRHILAELVADERYEPIALCRRPDRLGAAPVARIAADLTEPSTLTDLGGAEIVVHAAGPVSHAPRDARAMYDAHVRATEHLLDAAREAGVRRFVLLSSSGTVAVSDEATTLDETAGSSLAVTKAWPYYRAKLFAEQAALAANADGFDVVVLNPSLLLGPVAPPPFAEGAELSAGDEVLGPLLRAELPLAPSGGISFVDVRDVARAVLAAIHHGHPARRYLLAGANWTFEDFYARAGRVGGLRAPSLRTPSFGARLLSLLPKVATERLPASPTEWDMASHYWWADSTRAETELAFRPREPMDTLSEALLLARASGAGGEADVG